ncbi:MAG: hypothetical protein H6Q62_157, partial [Firmicutes bacterium]|nr:hypothetical protein [Bacillota bacterium]
MKSPDRFNLARSNQKSEQLIDFLIAAVLTAGIAALLFDFRRYEIVFWLTGL